MGKFRVRVYSETNGCKTLAREIVLNGTFDSYYSYEADGCIVDVYEVSNEGHPYGYQWITLIKDEAYGDENWRITPVSSSDKYIWWDIPNAVVEVTPLW